MDEGTLSVHQRHLFELSLKEAIPQDHNVYLENLKRSGFAPRVIYDIGANLTQWSREAKKIWPKARFILFEAVTYLEFLYQMAGYEYHIGVLSDRDGRVVGFYQNAWFPGGSSYYKEVGHERSADIFGEGSRTLRKTAALDSIVRKRKFPPPDLVKIDVQGSEKDIISGGQHALASATHLIVEMQHSQYNEGAPLVTETLPYIERLGWRCVAPLFCNNGPDGDYAFVRNR